MGSLSWMMEKSNKGNTTELRSAFLSGTKGAAHTDSDVSFRT